MILDNVIIKVINSRRFDEFNHLKGIIYQNKLTRYPEYLEAIHKLSKSLNIEPDQIEIFLFTFGRNLSDLKGEECYDYD